jgi:hypothetical protein
MQAAKPNLAIVMQQATYAYVNQMPALAIVYSNRKKPVVKRALPDASILSQQRYDYCNSYVTTYKDPFSKVVPDDLLDAFDLLLSRWLKPVTRRRVKNAGEENYHGYQILHQNENEIVVAKADKHLELRHSLLLQKTRKNSSQINISFSTAVSINTTTGALYIGLLKPFLKLLTPLLLKRLVKHL